MKTSILTVNAGSSSVKCALYELDTALPPIWSYKIERIGSPEAALITRDTAGGDVVQKIRIDDVAAAVGVLRDALTETMVTHAVAAVAHRIVLSADQEVHAILTHEIITTLRANIATDPEHLPLEIALIEMFATNYPEITQVACFDSVFHATMPRVARVFPLPRRLGATGLQKYGFHGLACSHVMEELARVQPSLAGGKVVIAHLGNGASVSAIDGGKSMDTSMGFTPVGGIPMSTRTGDIDPGALLFVMQRDKLSIEEAIKMVNHESGLLGISETSADMRDLLAIENADYRAREAIDHFCYEVKKRIGGSAAALGGLDVLVFSGGMGESAPLVRSRICRGLEFLGVHIDDEQNRANAEILSTDSSRVCVRIVSVNEELIMANIAQNLIANNN